MSASARRFFGCLLPAVFLVFGCGACALLGYAGQAFVQFETIRAADMGYPFQKGWTAISNSTALWGLNPSAGNIVTVVRPAGLAIRRVVGVPGESVAVRAGRFLVYNPDPKRQHRPTDTADPKVTLDGRDFVVWGRAKGADFGPVALAADQYFVWADNRTDDDSRTWGPVPRDSLFGRVQVVRRSDGEILNVVGGAPKIPAE